MNKSTKIEKQVARWDLYAKITPTFFLVASAISLTYGITSFDTLFNIGMVLFAFTAVTWWFWTIITIKYIIKTMSSATTDLLEVKQDLKGIREEIRIDSN
jgi:hypothetical protein